MLDITKNGNSIARISMYTYEEYERILELSKDELYNIKTIYKEEQNRLKTEHWRE